MPRSAAMELEWERAITVPFPFTSRNVPCRPPLFIQFQDVYYKYYFCNISTSNTVEGYVARYSTFDFDGLSEEYMT